MIVERVALALLILMAGVFGLNLATGTARFLDTFETYDQLTFSVVEFTYNGARTPVDIAIRVSNPSEHDIELTAIELTYRTAGRSMGGGEIRPNTVLPAGESVVVPFTGSIAFPAHLEELGPDPELTWVVNGRISVRLNPNLDREWVAFGFEAMT